MMTTFGAQQIAPPIFETFWSQHRLIKHEICVFGVFQPISICSSIYSLPIIYQNNQAHLKIYYLLNMGIFQPDVSFPGCAMYDLPRRFLTLRLWSLMHFLMPVSWHEKIAELSHGILQHLLGEDMFGIHFWGSQYSYFISHS